MLACAHPAFDGSVILFQNIIKVLHRSMPAKSSTPVYNLNEIDS
jgi:hypothetical protein